MSVPAERLPGPVAFVSQSPADAALRRGRALTEPALRQAVQSLPIALCAIAAYHLGWRDEPGDGPQTAVGKAFRPALAIAAARAVSGDPRPAIPAAVAVELVHNSSLLHDDVIDGSTTRRHRPTVWSLHGIAAAIMVGDALMSLAGSVLAGSGASIGAEAQRMLNDAYLELCDGQLADCRFETAPAVSLGECVAMAGAKTGALLGAACGLGALLCGGDSTQVQALDAFGRHVGLAFQCADDLLGIWGDPEVTGKPAGSDLSERKRSLPVTAAMNSATAAGRELAALYAVPGVLSEQDIRVASGLVEDAGGRRWAEQRAGQELFHAGERLAGVRISAQGREELLALAHRAVARNR